MQALGINISAVLPEVLLVLLAMIVMMVDAFAGKEENAAKNAIPWISLIKHSGQPHLHSTHQQANRRILCTVAALYRRHDDDGCSS